MGIVQVIATIVVILGNLYLLTMVARVILELVTATNRQWRPRGAGLIAAEVVYSVTDPPLKFFRRFIPPLRLGPVALDVGFMLTVFLCFIVINVAQRFAA